MNTAVKIAAIGTFSLGLGTAFYYLLNVFGKLASKESKRTLANYLLGSTTRIADTLPSTFADLLDRLFGSRPRSWRFFARSVIASTIFLVIIAIIWLFLNREYVSQTPSTSYPVVILVLAFFINFVPDYLSLIKSRFLIRRMQGRGSVTIFLLLLVDLAATTILVFLSFLTFAHIIPGDKSPGSSVFSETITIVLEGYRLWTAKGFLGIFIYTTYFSTFLWAFLYAVLALLSRIIVGLSSRTRRVFALLAKKRVREKPYTVVGLIGALLLFFGSSVLLLIATLLW